MECDGAEEWGFKKDFTVDIRSGWTTTEEFVEL